MFFPILSPVVWMTIQPVSLRSVLVVPIVRIGLEFVAVPTLFPLALARGGRAICLMRDLGT